MNWLARFFRAFILLGALAIGLLALYQYRLPPAPPLPLPPLSGQIDHILVEKSARRLTVYRDGAALRTYRIALGFAPTGDKLRQGDGKTPEGTFRIDRRNAASAFHLSLGLDYPQRDDLIRARAGSYAPGGDIFIHGRDGKNRGRGDDWTAGCIAVKDREIRKIYAMVRTGTEIHIYP
mgnify:CR=1 FL=1